MKLAFVNGWTQCPWVGAKHFWRFSVDRAPGNWTSYSFLGFTVFILY